MVWRWLDENSPARMIPVKLHELDRPPLSKQRQVTSVSPRLNKSPDMGLQTDVMLPSSASLQLGMFHVRMLPVFPWRLTPVGLGGHCGGSGGVFTDIWKK